MKVIPLLVASACLVAAYALSPAPIRKDLPPHVRAVQKAANEANEAVRAWEDDQDDAAFQQRLNWIARDYTATIIRLERESQ